MLSVKKLAKEYQGDVITRALVDVSFEIKEGEFVSIMGPSGSGKSTLLHILSFLDRPTSGEYLFNKKSIQELDDRELARVRNKEMGFIFQSFNLLSRSTVYDNVEIPLIYANVPVIKRRKMVEDAIRAVGLEEKINVEAGKLSGGQKQRVAIARALVNNPPVIFADEPTGNLDSKSGLQIMGILKELHNQGRTVILVTHETYTAGFGDRLVRLKDGLIEYDGKMPKADKMTGEFLK